MKTDEPIVAFSKATEEGIGDQPMIPDPYESRTVEVKRMSCLFSDGTRNKYFTSKHFDK